MSDEVLRALEREGRATRAPEALLRWAAALERVGRRVEAIEALGLGREHREVRRALADRAEPGPVPVARPTELFRVKLGGTDRPRLVAAGPLGVVLGGKARTALLDPDTGASRHVLPGAAWHAVAGDVLLRIRGKPATLEAHDAWTGEPLYQARVGGRATSARLGAGWLVLADPRRLTAWRFEQPRQPPERVWQVTLAAAGHALVDERVLVQRKPPDALVLLDLRSGEVVRELPSGGLWVQGGEGLGLYRAWDPPPGLPPRRSDRDPLGWPHVLVAVDLGDGSLRWSREHLGGVVAAPGALIALSTAYDPRGDLVERLDPASGERLPGAGGAVHLGADAAAPGGEVDLLCQSGAGRVHAWPRGSDRIAWTWSLSPSLSIDPAHGVRPAAGRVYVLSGRATVTCLAAPG